MELDLKPLSKFKNLLAVYLFGSSVYGQKGKLSDFDVGVVFENPQEILSNPKRALKIYEKLFDLFAPLARRERKSADKLDLVFLL